MKTDDESKVRQEAVQRFLQGEKPSQICQKLGRTRQWFYTWLGRYRSGSGVWYRERPRVPHQISNRLEAKLEAQIVNLRQQLMTTPYSQIGANAINWELQKRGVPPVPLSTINAVIRRHRLHRPPAKRPSQHKAYVEWPREAPNDLHQADLVGPRFIKNDGRFYSLHVMDVATHRVKINPVRTKEDGQIARALLSSWQALGLPQYLQLDNELSYRGSNRHPHSFGLVLKLCLRLRVVPVFIPLAEPWRNGEIERFQGVFDRMFFRAQFFPSFDALCQEAPQFEEYHNRHHVYSCLGGRTPQAAFDQAKAPMDRRPDGFQIPEGKFLIDDGSIHLVRFIRSDRVLNVFGEKFLVRPELVYEYVVATICTDSHQLQVRHDDQLVQWFDYSLPLEQVSTMSMDIFSLKHR
jgi:transposase InsO family protein